MTNETRAAKALCTKNERALVQDSLPGDVDSLSPRGLRSRVTRARTLRDKYRDLHQRQRGGARGKLSNGRPKELHDCTRTREKAELFARTLERFEREMRAVAGRKQEARRRISSERRSSVQQNRRWEAARADSENHQGPPRADAGPREPFGASPPRPGAAMREALTKSAAGRFRNANRRFQAHRDRDRR